MASYLKATIHRSYAESFLAELERNENQYFFFISKATPWSNENSPDTYTDTVSSEYQIMNDVIGYKKLNPENILFALPRHPWESGTVYDQYDDSVELFDENNPSIFYVVTDENHIYKCISNADDSPSTSKPSQILTIPFKTDDGYVWKYISTVKESNLPYELTDYIPVEFAYTQNDTETQNQYNTQIQAVDGAISTIQVTNSSGACAGAYPYSVYRTSSIGTNYVIQLAGITGVSGDSTLKFVTVTETDSKGRVQAPENTIGYVMRIDNSTLHPEEINNYGIIVDAGKTGSNDDRYFVVKNDVIDFTFTKTGNGNIASCEILPYVKIVGNGSGAYAFPQMKADPSDGSGLDKNISSVSVVRGGRNYSKAIAQVTTTKATTTNHPVLRAVLSPKGGHGSNILKELNVKDILLIVSLSEEDAKKIAQGGSYRQFGIIKNPVLSNGSGTLAGKSNPNYKDITLISESGTVSEDDFKPYGSEGNFIIGTESYSLGKIVELRSINDTNTQIVLKTLNSSGNFITRQNRINDYIVTLSSSNGFSYFDGETVSQTIPAGTIVGSVTYGYSLTVSGTVVSRSANQIIVQLTTDGNFVVGRNIVGNLSAASTSVSSVSPRYGELVWITSTNQTSGISSFLTKSNSQKLYRVTDVGSAYFDSQNTPAYSGLHALTLTTSVGGAMGALDTTSSSLSPSSYSSGDVVYQGVTNGISDYATGTVYKWDYINPTKGVLYLTDVLGNFKSVATNGITGSTMGAYIVAGVSLPDIIKTSGEVLYIDNVRPIQRTSTQKEEFRLRLGF